MAIDVAAQARYWRDGALDDLGAAGLLLNAAKLRQAAFFVHLAIEKALKACVVESTREIPPRSHDLLLLVQRGNILVSDAQRDFLSRIQLYCLEGRYPSELPDAPSAAAVKSDLEEATELVKWLIERLKNA